MTTPLLVIDSLSVSIDDVPLINNLSLNVGYGEIVGLVGASGSGKSMTALAIMQLLPSRARSSGDIFLNDVPLNRKNERELTAIRGRNMGIIFQEPMSALNPLMRIGDQVAETVRLHGKTSASAASLKAREALDAVGLAGAQGALDRYPHELSGGQRQRVAIAIAVVLRPALLIADEPTTALDAVTQGQILTLLCGLARTQRMGLILVSHDLAVIAQVTDRVAVLHAGEIVEQGPTAHTLQHLRHPFSKALLAAAAPVPKQAVPKQAVPKPAVPVRSSDAVLEVHGVVREYALKRRSPWRKPPVFRAVDDVSMCVYAGETVGLVGESGSGKSSLLRAVLGLERTQSGDVRVFGESLSMSTSGTRRRLRRSLQAVFQDPYGSFDPRWTVERLIGEPFFLMDPAPTRAERRRQVAAVLEQVGMSSADALRHPHEFSGGERQRIAIARALITKPAVIAFDEAVSALDVIVRAQILDLLAELSDRLRLSYLFVSHDLAIVRAIADRVYVIQRGRIVEHGLTVDVFGSPQHAYTRALISATPRLAQRA